MNVRVTFDVENITFITLTTVSNSLLQDLIIIEIVTQLGSMHNLCILNLRYQNLLEKYILAYISVISLH